MSQDNQITLRGYLTADPKFFVTTRAGAEVAEVRLGSTHQWVDRTTGEWREAEPTYYTVKCWRKLALNVKASLHKGDRVLVRGRFNTRTWTDEQERRRVDVEVEADSIGHDLVFGMSIFTRTQTPRNVTQALANGEQARAELDGESDAYQRDDYALGGSGDPFPLPHALADQDPDEDPDEEQNGGQNDPDEEEAAMAAEPETAVATPF